VQQRQNSGPSNKAYCQQSGISEKALRLVAETAHVPAESGRQPIVEIKPPTVKEDLIYIRFRKYCIARGCTDLRRGIAGLPPFLSQQFGQELRGQSISVLRQADRTSCQGPLTRFLAFFVYGRLLPFFSAIQGLAIN
jgi:hypothetical protein